MSVLVANEAPDFTAPAVMPDGSIEDEFKLSDLRGRYVILFFWPLDFTFVCPTEILAHDHRSQNFEAVCSPTPVSSHLGCVIAIFVRMVHPGMHTRG